MCPAQRDLRDDAARELLGLTRQIADEQLRPAAAAAEAEGRFPREKFALLGEAGLLGLPYPERLGGAAEPGEPVEPPPGATRAGELLHVVDARWWCNGADLGPVDGSWKAHAAHQQLTFAELAPEFGGGDPEMAAKITLHAWYCPVTGYRLDLELARGDEPPLADMVLASG